MTNADDDLDDVAYRNAIRRRNVISSERLLGRLYLYHPDQVGMVTQEALRQRTVYILPTEAAVDRRLDMDDLSINRITAVVADFYGLTLSQITGRSRSHHICIPRQIAMYLAIKYVGMSSPDVGAYFDRDHTTVLHAAQKFEEIAKTDSRLSDEIRLVKLRLIGAPQEALEAA